MLSPAAGVGWLALTGVLLLAVAGLADRTSLLARIPLSKPVPVLLDHAEDVPTEPRLHGRSRRSVFVLQARPCVSGVGRAPRKRRGPLARAGGRTSCRRAVLVRTSPVAIIAKNPLNSNDLEDPPLDCGLDPPRHRHQGTAHLVHRRSAPGRFVAPGPGRRTGAPSSPRLARSATFTETTPARTPLAFADERRAWRGTLPETKTPVTIEAAAYRGRPVSFELVGSLDPGLTSSRMRAATPGIRFRPESFSCFWRRPSSSRAAISDRAAPIGAAHSGWP